ncbi:MAG: DNA polymerase III subunit chi [Betaproteobacteria bacterium]|nr:DNA polymerase III subunit chi [Betaproteobacteria bacterium]
MNFACKLAKRAYDDGRKLVVYAPTPALADEFDRALWTFSQLSFVPHVKASHALAAETPIVIALDDASLPHHEALLNLGNEPPAFFSRFEALRELVLAGDEDRALARERARFYKSRGFDVTHTDIKVHG